MLELPDVTLICLTSLDFEGHKKAIDKSCEQISFGGIKLIWDEKITSIDKWNYEIIYNLYKYIDTPYALLIHSDGYIIDSTKWRDDFLRYDFCGAPWPLPTDDHSFRSESGKIQRVGNSVSLRSKKLMERVAQFPWQYYYGNCHEDGFTSVHHRDQLESEGFTFAPLELAVHFSKEHIIEENRDIMNTFCFHSI